jgi:predicted 3-demethylubiquinone-9 3-methyltransferase (glyoxalase superfamily)
MKGPKMQKITPFLWFDGKAEEAANFYVSVFSNSKIKGITRYGEGMPLPAGSVMTASFEIEGYSFVGLNGGPQFPFTEAISLAVSCGTQAELDEIWAKLTSDGGKEIQCGWLKDKYGLSWQIVPAMLGQLMEQGNPKKSAAMMQAMMGMVKLDIAALQKAYDNG